MRTPKFAPLLVVCKDLDLLFPQIIRHMQMVQGGVGGGELQDSATNYASTKFHIIVDQMGVHGHKISYSGTDLVMTSFYLHNKVNRVTHTFGIDYLYTLCFGEYLIKFSFRSNPIDSQ